MDKVEMNTGAFQRGMGAKAGGFVAQKHFHPTNNQNLSKIYMNQKK